MWQDYVLSIANYVISYAVLVQVWHGFKEKRKLVTYQTSLLYCLSLFAMAYAFYSLGNFGYSTVSYVIIGSLWGILFIQSLIYSKKKRK